MANTRQIKRRIVASQNISKITKAMEMVAASKMKRAQDQALAARPYAQVLQESLHKLAEHTGKDLHPLFKKNETGKAILTVISTDRGQCGSLNTILFKNMVRWLREHQDGQIIAVGKKAVAFCRANGIQIYAQFTSLPEKISLRDILPIATLVMQKFLSSEFRSVEVLNTDFVNTLTQRPNMFQLLPIEPEPMYQETSTSPVISSEYVFEPSARAILDQLLPYFIENSLYQTFLESRASEHSARMVSMKNASENAKDLVTELQLLYNKSRQANITNELLDITTAALTVS